MNGEIERRDRLRTTETKIANRLKHRRLAKHWSQDDLAKESGVSRNEISRIELAKIQPRIETVQKLAKALGCRTIELID